MVVVVVAAVVVGVVVVVGVAVMVVVTVFFGSFLGVVFNLDQGMDEVRQKEVETRPELFYRRLVVA